MCFLWLINTRATPHKDRLTALHTENLQAMVKYNLLQSQLLNPLINYAGPAATSNSGSVYLSSWIELGVMVGIVGLGALLVMLGLGKLNLGDDVYSEKPKAAVTD